MRFREVFPPAAGFPLAEGGGLRRLDGLLDDGEGSVPGGGDVKTPALDEIQDDVQAAVRRLDGVFKAQA